MATYQETFTRALQLARHLDRRERLPGVTITDRNVAIAQIACVRRGYDLAPRQAGVARSLDRRGVIVVMPCKDGNVIFAISLRGQPLIVTEMHTPCTSGEEIAELNPPAEAAERMLRFFVRNGWPPSAKFMVEHFNRGAAIYRAQTMSPAGSMLN